MTTTDQSNTLALLGTARHALVEARTVQDLRRVMEAAKVAADAGLRAAKLMEAQGIAADVVAQATEAAREAGAVRLEAQAKAGEILAQMKAQGDLTPGDRRKPEPGSDSAPSRRTVPEVMGVEDGGPGVAAAYLHSAQWQRVAAVPSEVRATYIRQTEDMPTTAGLLRFAAEPKPDTRSTVELAYDTVVRALGTVVKYDPAVMAGHASATGRKDRFRKALDRLVDWVDNVDQAYGGRA